MLLWIFNLQKQERDLLHELNEIHEDSIRQDLLNELKKVQEQIDLLLSDQSCDKEIKTLLHKCGLNDLNRIYPLNE